MTTTPQANPVPSKSRTPARPSGFTPSGFTLVELLVVIGIISVLIAILLPTLGKARAQARRTVCLSNVRQLANYAIQYANDNKGRFPLDHRSRFNEVAPDGFRVDMYEAMKMPKYVRPSTSYTETNGPLFWRCPDRDEFYAGGVIPADPASDYYLGVDAFSASYMYTGAGGGPNWSSGSADSVKGRRPERLGERSGDGKPKTLFADRVVWFDDFRGYVINHIGRNGRASVLGGNQAFTDGHAEWIPAQTSGATVPNLPGYPARLIPGFAPTGNAAFKHVSGLPNGYASYWW